MLLFLFAIVFSAGTVWFFNKEWCLRFSFSVTLAILSLISWVILPLGGYTYEEVARTEFSQLKDVAYVGDSIITIDADGSEEFFEKVESYYAQGDATAYRLISNQSIFVVESPSIKALTFVEYEKAGKFNLWSLGVYCEYDYVFYVPVGTVAPPQIEEARSDALT